MADTLADVVARIEPPSGFSAPMIHAASAQACDGYEAQGFDRSDPFTYRVALFRWAIERRDRILKELEPDGG